jgi:hypothetical protein
MKTLYEKEYTKIDPNAKSEIFNLDKVRLSLKTPYKAPGDFVSINKQSY